MTRALSYKDISIIPRYISEQLHRTGNTSREAFGIKLDLPIIASPMPDVCGDEMARELSRNGCLGIIHRFMSMDEQVLAFKSLPKTFEYFQSSPTTGGVQVRKSYAACAIGVSGDYKERYVALWNAGCRIFCFDTANGANVQVGEAIKFVQTLRWPNMPDPDVKPYIIAGNVATRQGFKYLAQFNIDAIRVGIAGGSVCETRVKTGIYYPMVSSVRECVNAKLEMKLENIELVKNQQPEKYTLMPLLIADGGIAEPQDLCKALAIGADLIMGGNMFAGTAETPGNVRKIKGILYKEYKGAASFAVQHDYNGENPDHVEGDETLVPYKGHVSKVIKDYKEGLQSSMSYLNANNLQEYFDHAEVIEI